MNNLLFSIRNQVIVITGGTGVLGSTIAVYLAEEGAKVIVIGRNPEHGKIVMQRIKAVNGEGQFFQANVLDRKSLITCRDKVLKQYGRIDTLINAAGGNQAGATIPPDKNIFDLDEEAMRQVIDVNLMGTVISTQVFLEPMVKQEEGSIVNFSSMSAFRPLTRVIGYSAAKSAINNITQYMATEVATKFGSGIRINAIAPGFFLTEQNRTLLTNPDGSKTARAKKIIEQTPFGRFGKPEELCGTIQYLISKASMFVTGTVAVVDGGFNAFCL
jgi:NAD(P)-dependent dehydrogenase (short-subunit alcohol dehydrogenase family)